MSARCALSYLRDQGATVHLDGGDLVIEGIELSGAMVARLRSLKAEIVAELSLPPTQTCWVCGSPHAPFGMGWSWRSPSASRWYCTEHWPEPETVASSKTLLSPPSDAAPDWTTAPVLGWPHHLDIFDHTKGRVVRIRLNG